jgi:hypothetical protein
MKKSNAIVMQKLQQQDDELKHWLLTGEMPDDYLTDSEEMDVEVALAKQRALDDEAYDIPF